MNPKKTYSYIINKILSEYIVYKNEIRMWIMSM
jgi:hypothetical protein